MSINESYWTWWNAGDVCVLLPLYDWGFRNLCMLRHLNMHPVSFNSSVDLSLFMFMGRFSRSCLMFVASSFLLWGMGTWQYGIRAPGCNSGPLWAKKVQCQKVELPSLFSREQRLQKNRLSAWTVGRVNKAYFHCGGRIRCLTARRCGCENG